MIGRIQVKFSAENTDKLISKLPPLYRWLCIKLRYNKICDEALDLRELPLALRPIGFEILEVRLDEEFTLNSLNLPCGEFSWKQSWLRSNLSPTRERPYEGDYRSADLPQLAHYALTLAPLKTLPKTS